MFNKIIINQSIEHHKIYVLVKVNSKNAEKHNPKLEILERDNKRGKTYLHYFG